MMQLHRAKFNVKFINHRPEENTGARTFQQNGLCVKSSARLLYTLANMTYEPAQACFESTKQKQGKQANP